MPEIEQLQRVIQFTQANAFYPAVATDIEIAGPKHPMLVCANGHRWGSIDPEAGCPVCIRNHQFRLKGRTECTEERCDRLVTCSDRLWEDGVRKCQIHWADEAGFTAGPICLDELVTVMGQYMPRARWNGWLQPVMDPWAVEKVMAAFADDGLTDPAHAQHRWEGETLVLTEFDGDTEYPQHLEPDEDGLYALGASSWTWSEDTEENAYKEAHS